MSRAKAEVVPTFTTAQFMSAGKKAMVYKAWVRFVKGGFKRTQFTKALYHHLIQNCSFIAHYNLYGFYDDYFSDSCHRQLFESQFDRNLGCESAEYSGDAWLRSPDYRDINNAMADYFTKHKYGGCRTGQSA